MSRSSALQAYLEDTWFAIAICAVLQIGILGASLLWPDTFAAMGDWIYVHIFGLPADDTIQLPSWTPSNPGGLPPLHPTIIA